MIKGFTFIIITLLFSKVFETDSCSSVNKIRTKYLIDERRMPCTGEFSNEWCMNGGTCYVIKHRSSLDYHCECLEHFSGDRCLVDNRNYKKSFENREPLDFKNISTREPCKEPFKSNFCLNEGTCYALIFDNIPEYHCECPNNFHGYKCEEKALDGFYGNGLKKIG